MGKKTKIHIRIGHEGSQGKRGIAVLFLWPRR